MEDKKFIRNIYNPCYYTSLNRSCGMSLHDVGVLGLSLSGEVGVYRRECHKRRLEGVAALLGWSAGCRPGGRTARLGSEGLTLGRVGGEAGGGGGEEDLDGGGVDGFDPGNFVDIFLDRLGVLFWIVVQSVLEVVRLTGR